MAKKRRLDQILENRQKAKQNTSNSGNIRTMSTGLPTTRQQIVMPRRTATEVQALAQSLYNRRSDMTAEQQKVINVAQNYTPIKQNGLAPSNEDKNKAIVQKAVSNYNPNFRNEKNLSKEAIKYNPEAKQLTTWDKVQQTANKNAQENQDKKWYQKFVQESGALKDGYQVGDLSQATGATALEGVLQVVKPFSDLGTGLANIGATGVAQVADWIGKDEFANRLRKAIGANESVVDTGIKLANQDSVLGDTTDTILNAFGQYVLNAIGGQALGKAGQMKILGVNAPTLSVISSFGQGLKKGYSDEDYKNWQVYLKASGDAVIEGMTEGLNDVLGVGGSTLSDMLKGNAMKPFKSGLAKALARTGLSSAEEGLEEVLSYLGSLGLDNLIGYLEVSLNQGDGEKWKREFNKDEFWENFWVGTISALATEAPNTAITHNAITQKAIQDKTNELSRELTQNEKQQISKDAILNYETNIQKDYTKGNKITNQIKNSGLTENQQQKLTEVAQKYDLSQADIQNLIDNTKNGKYDQKQATTMENKPISNQSQQVIQQEGKIDEKATSQQIEQNIEKGKYNRVESVKNFLESAKKYNKDTNSDTLKEMVRVADERQVDLRYDASVFKGNKNQNAIWKIKKDENGKVISREVILNPDSTSDANIEQIWTHEITHDMEGSGKYAKMRKQLLDYLQKKPEYQSAFNDLKAIYSEVYAEENLTEQEFNELIEDEVVADMLGSKLGDTDFLSKLNKENRTVAQKIYDWVVDRLNKINKLTGYKNEKLFWQDIKNKFENAFKEDYVDTDIMTKYSVEKDNKGRTLSKEEQDFIKDNGITDENGNALELYHGTPYKDIISEFDSKLAGSNTQSDFEGIYFTDNKEVAEDFSYQQLQGNSNLTYKRGEKGQVINAYLKAKKPLNLNTLTDEDIDNLAPYIDKQKAIDGVEFALNTMKQMNKYKNAQGVKFYLDMKALQNAGYDALIADMGGNYKGSNEYIVFNSTQIKTKQENSDVKYSLSSTDNQGRTLSKEQQEYFKDSKVRDENGNLLEVYHGTEADFTVFNKDFIGYNGTQYGKGFYYSSRPEIAKQYERGNGKTLKGYLKIDNPLSMTEKTMSLDTFTDLVHRINKQTNGMFYKKLQDKLSLSSTKQTISLEEWQQLVKDFGKENYISTWSDETRADKGTSSIYNLCSNDFDVYRSLINSLGMEDTQKFIEEVQNRFSNKVNVEENIKELYDLFNYDNEILIRFDKYSDEMRDEYKFDVYKTVEDMGYDGLISKDMFITFNSNQFKNVDNTKPTKDPDIRYSLSQETKANLEAKIDRYSKLVEEMQQNGRDAEEWAPYANEILRLQDQLDGNRFSRESTGAWNEFKNKYGKNEGRGKTNAELTLEQPKKVSEVLKPKKKVSEVLPKQTYETILAKAEYISKEEKQALLKEAKENNFSLEEVKETVQQLNDYYKQQDDNKLDTNKTYATGRNELYSKYMNKNTKYDNSSLNRAKELIKANNQGRRTKEQWLNIAKQIGTDIANKSNSEIEEIAYRTWQDERPNLKESLNRQGEKYVKFTSDEWINTIYNEVKKQRELQPKQTIQAEKRQLVDEVYREDIAEGKIRKHYKSVFDSDQVGDVGKDVAKELLKKDTYVPISNLETITAVNDNISRNGIGATYNAFRTKVRSNEKITLQDVATGERLIQIYSQKGDYAKVNELIQDVAILGTELGQQVQALSLIKRASPEGQLQYLTKLLERTNIKENTNIKITDEMTEKILGAKNQEDLEKKLTEVAVELAEQLPVSKSDMIRSWRYLSMLGNPKTHIKNLGANVAMNLTQRAKNAVAGAIEGVASVFNPEMERTKTIKFANREQKQFAKQDAELMKDLIDAGGKYDVKNVIQESKKQFNNKVLNAIAEFNSNLLDVEDKIFLKSAYKMAMQNYMSANNLKASDMEGKTLEKARQYASLQAQEATFHEFNEVAQHLSQIENKGGLVGGAMSAILPFKKTPMNIAKAGVQYSPVGLASAVTYDIAQIAKKTKTYKQQLADGKITEAEYKAETSKMVNKTIDNMAKGLTGTSLAVLGYALAKMGVLKAGNDGEDDEFKQKLGEQEYAITIGDNTYTLDWVSPSAIPMFTGASIYQLMTGDVEDQKSILNSTLTAFSKTFEPMTDMSMLQGLTSAITSYEQGSSNMIFDLGASMVTSYAGQFVPTVAGQVARIADPYERDTSSTKKGIEGKVDKFAKQTMNKIPGLSRKLPKKTDVWGEDVKRPENLVQRTLETAVLPWTRKALVEDRTAQELLKVFDESGENVLPGNPNKDLTINKIKYRLTTEEYNEAKRNFGQTSKALLDDLFKSKTYNTLTAEGKAKAIDDVYAYAKEKIKVEYAEDNNYAVKPTNLYNTISSLEENNADVSAYFEFKGKIDDLDREKGEESVKNKEKMSYLKEMKTDAKTKRIIYEDTLGTNDEVYQNLSKLTGNKVNINQYLDYKTRTDEFEADDDPKSNIKGKKLKGDRERKINNYINNSNFSDAERLYIYGTLYSLDLSERERLTQHINNAKAKGRLTASEEKELYKKLKSVEELENGQIRWK